MKKSKVIIPALGVLILSTAASVTGTVAWFTANRTATITAGEFAVVKTSNDLDLTIVGDIGTTVAKADPGDAKETIVNTKANYKLTDSSFDHTAISGTVMPIVIPDVPRKKVLSNVQLEDATESNLERGTNIYSAFTWTMEFTVTFSEGSNKKQGLYLDLSDDATYMHEKVTYASTHTITATEAGTYFTDAACTTGSTTVVAGATLAAGTWYKVAPDATGKAFRIAFVPTAISTDGTACMAYTKVWADNEGNGTEEEKFIDGLAVDAELAPAGTKYNTETVSYNGSAYVTAAAGSGKVLMHNGDNSGIPADGSRSSTTALSGDSNYLGYFSANPGKNVSITYTCVAWFEGTHPQIVGTAIDFESIVASMKFGVTEFTD